MWRRRLFWKLFPTYTLVIVFCIALVGGYLVRQERKSARMQLETDLALVATVLDDRLQDVLDEGRAARADSLVRSISPPDTRITLIAPSGRVIADTNVDPSGMENHRFRPEVQAALQGRVGSATRLSRSDFASHLYVAVPSASHPGWVVRVAIPLRLYERRLHQATSTLLIGGLVAVGLALLLGFVFIRQIVRPLENLERGLERLERGEFGARLEPGTSDEIGHLARTLNRVQERLEGTIEGLTSQRNQRDAILSSMVEGLVAVDSDDRVLLVNAAAREFLALATAECEGRPLLEIVRIPRLVQFVEEVRGATQPLRVELVVRDLRARYLELHGAPMRMSDTGPAGVVIVFNDVTRLRKLEEVRKEFVANVSHELKTPITSIKGFLETLIEGGALDEPESARRFLGIIQRQSNRLAAIIEDLLYLSRLEYEEKPIALQPVDLSSVVQRCVANFEHQAHTRGIDLRVQVEAQHTVVLGDGSLLARALDNLVDNAIKYSPDGRPVEVALRGANGDLLLQVTDRGIGIPEEHLPRISERFYRVDTARSRELGGTGLGLAIVKHIARVHAGRLEIESRWGEGSRFTIRIPHTAGRA
jgi:two-component system, OmpR family, phosphate regulon sensor histidine kinase PhoR